MDYYDIAIRDNKVDIIVTKTKPAHHSALKTLQKIKEVLGKVQLAKQEEECLIILAERIFKNYNAKVEKTNFITRFFIKYFGDYKEINALHRQIVPVVEMPDEILAIFAKNWIEDWLHGKMTFKEFNAKFAINRQYRRIMDTELKDYIKEKTGYTITGKAIDFVGRVEERIASLYRDVLYYADNFVKPNRINVRKLQELPKDPWRYMFEELIFFSLIGVRNFRFFQIETQEVDDYLRALPYLRSCGYPLHGLAQAVITYSLTAKQFDQLLDFLFPPGLAQDEKEKNKKIVTDCFARFYRINRDYKKEMVFLTRLAEKTGDPNLEFETESRNMVHVLRQVIYQSNAELALRLLKLPGVQARGCDLWLAAQKGLLQAVDALLKKGVNPNLLVLHDMNRPLLIALYEEHWPVIERLLQDNRTSIGKDSAGDSDLILAMRNASCPAHILALFLSKKDVNVNEIDSRGLSPLIYAIRNRNTAAIRVLLDKGANLDQQTHEGTPRELLRASGLSIPEG